MMSLLDPPWVHPGRLFALRHPAELAPAADVGVHNLREFDGRVESHEGVKGTELRM
jgi:hypothetical protein